MAMKPLRQLLDANRKGMIGVDGKGYIYASVLAATTTEVVTVPTGAKYVLFKSTGTFWANLGAAAAIPSTEVADGSASLLNPELRGLDGAATIGLIAPAICTVTMEFFS